MSHNGTSLENLLAKRNELEQEIQRIQQEERFDAVNQIFTIMETYDLGIEDLQKRPRKKRVSSGVSVPPKYTDGDSTWTGRGRKPAWVEEYLSSGGVLEDLLIDKD